MPYKKSASPILTSSASVNPTYAVETRKKPSNIPLTLGAWNIRTLIDHRDADRPERRTALIVKEVVRYKIDIAALMRPKWQRKDS